MKHNRGCYMRKFGAMERIFLLISYIYSFFIHYPIERVKTTYMENVSTGVIDKNKEHYLRCKDKANNHIKTYTITYVKIPIK